MLAAMSSGEGMYKHHNFSADGDITVTDRKAFEHIKAQASKQDLTLVESIAQTSFGSDTQHIEVRNADDNAIEILKSDKAEPCTTTDKQRAAVINGRSDLKSVGGGSAGKDLATLLPDVVDNNTELTIPSGAYPGNITSKDFTEAMEAKGYTLKPEYQGKEGNKALWQAVQNECVNSC